MTRLTTDHSDFWMRTTRTSQPTAAVRIVIYPIIITLANHTRLLDEEGRYAYKNQPKIGRWNLEKLAEVLAFWLDETKAAEILKEYDTEFETTYLTRMRNKIGLVNTSDATKEQDLQLIEELFNVMEKTGLDFTNTFRGFNKTDIADLKEFSSETELSPSKCCTPFLSSYLSLTCYD